MRKISIVSSYFNKKGETKCLRHTDTKNAFAENISHTMTVGMLGIWCNTENDQECEKLFQKDERT